MKRKLKAGQTAVSLPIFVHDTSSLTGGGLSGLTSATSGLVAEYRRRGESSWSTITLASKTLGTWTSGGLVADGALAGAYEFDLPDAVCAENARWVAVRLRGAANMLPVLIEIELDAVDYQDAAGFGLSRIDQTIGSRSTLDAAGVRTAVGLASANLDTQLITIASYIDTEVAAIKAKTDNLPASPAATSDIPSATTIADAVLSRSVANTESSMPEHCLGTIVLATLEGTIDATTWTIKRTDGATTHATKTVTRSAADSVASVQ